MGEAMFNVPEALGLNKAQAIGRKIIYKSTTTTTMDDAREYGLKYAPHGTAVLAELQTDARGAKNNKWSALHTGNIFVSFVLHNAKGEKGWIQRFTCEVAAALAVHRAVSELGISDIHTKWPNDLWIRGHKLAGFLMEEVDFDIPKSCPQKHLAILGIGVNVNSDVRRNPGLYSLATSVRCEIGGSQVSREELFSKICLYLEENLEKPREVIHEEFLRYQLFVPGKDVTVHCINDNETLPAQIVEIKNNWNIVFKTRNDEVKEMDSSICSIRPRCSKIIYVVSGGNLNVKSSQQLHRILLTLVDTSIYNIKYLKMDDIEKDYWKENACLVVIGDISPSLDCDWSKSEAILKAFVENGGSLICIGQILGQLDVTKSVIGKTVNTSGESGIDVILSENSDNKLNLCCCGNCLELIPEPDDVSVAVYSSFDKAVAILKRRLGRGILCMCGLNLEISYIFDEIDGMCDSGMKNGESEENVFHKDQLFRHILKSLLIF